MKNLYIPKTFPFHKRFFVAQKGSLDYKMVRTVNKLFWIEYTLSDKNGYEEKER